MKKLLIILLMGTVFSLQAQVTKDTLSTQISQVERIIDKYIIKISETFSQITPTAKEGFKVVVRLQIIKGLTELLPLFFMFISLHLFNKEYKRIQALLLSDNTPESMNKEYGPLDESNITPILTFYGIIIVIMTTLALFTTWKGVLHLFAPEWYAIEEILNLIK